MRAQSRRKAFSGWVPTVLAVCAALLPLSAAPAAADSPTISNPPPVGTPIVFEFQEIAQVGYRQREFFLSGNAHSYSPVVPLSLSQKGAFMVTPDPATAPYTTRVVVERPIDPHRFNGAVWVEWLNVSGGVDAGPDWTLAHNEAVREGAVWVGTSAQKVGVDSLKGPPVGNPGRYGSLSHPGDSYSYDIFSQAGQALRDHAATLLGGLVPQRIIAIGESQSAARLVTYIDAVHPLVNVYDGFLVHSRFAQGAPLKQAPLPSIPVPNPTLIRADLAAPVLVFETETDVSFSNLMHRQPDTHRFRLWEVAGTSHFDFYGLVTGLTDIGNGQGAVEVLQAMQNPPSQTTAGTCNLPINTGPMHWVLDDAVFQLDRWVKEGTVPPVAPRLRTIGVSPVVFATDAHGNVLGGIRTPQVDAPVATLSGVGNTGAAFCFLFGRTIPFSPAELAGLYKNHGQFVSQWGQAAHDAVKAGFLVQPDAVELLKAAAKSQIGM
jgi:hypothetical protein